MGEDWPIISLEENGDQSFLLFFFFETMLRGEHLGKVSKKFMGNFFSKEKLSELKFLFIIMHANQDSKGTSYSNMHTSDSS